MAQKIKVLLMVVMLIAFCSFVNKANALSLWINEPYSNVTNMGNFTAGGSFTILLEKDYTDAWSTSQFRVRFAILSGYPNPSSSSEALYNNTSIDVTPGDNNGRIYNGDPFTNTNWTNAIGRYVKIIAWDNVRNLWSTPVYVLVIPPTPTSNPASNPTESSAYLSGSTGGYYTTNYGIQYRTLPNGSWSNYVNAGTIIGLLPCQDYQFRYWAGYGGPYIGNYGTVYSPTKDFRTLTPSISQNTNPDAATICYNATHTFSLAAATGGTGITYQWEQSSNNSSWSNASGTNNQQNYTTPSLNNNMYYRRRATNNCGSVSTSNSALVTVNANFTQYNPSAATICYNATHTFSLAAATGGSGTLSYQWQSSTNNSSWTNISGATNANYTTPVLTSNMYYRRQATRATCGGTITSSSALVTVNDAFTQNDPVAASISNGSTHTFNLVAATGGSGTLTYQWQSSSNNSTWTDISGATSANYTTSELTSDMYYRRKATRTTCGGTITSASALVTVTRGGRTTDYGIDMITVAGGTTTIRDIAVTVSTFQIGKYEITQKQWEDVMKTIPAYASNPWLGDNYVPSDTYGKGNNYPAYFVSWEDAQVFIAQLNNLTGKNYRLPTAAEWEYAAKGGQQTHNYTYSGSNALSLVAWHGGNSSGKTHPVGSLVANELGIYDMSGNVWEWCNDWATAGTYPSGTYNPTGPATGTNRAIRGGSWNSGAQMAYQTSTSQCEITYMGGFAPNNRYLAELGNSYRDGVGFRVALSTATTAVETTEADKFTIYPNPAKDELFIQSGQPVKKVQISDIAGRVVISTNSTTVNVSHLPKGIYFVKIFVGGQGIIKKIIKE